MSKKNWPYDEFAAETSPEYQQLFAEIAGELAYRRKLKMVENDRFLRDYRSAWQGTMKDQDGSILDPPIPAAYAQKCMELAGPQSTRMKERKDYSTTVGNQTTVYATESGVVMMQAANTIHVDPDDLQALIDALNAAKATVGPMAPDPIVGAYPGRNSSNYRYSQNARVIADSEQRKTQLERNLKEMEKWAKASASSYPRYG